MPLSGAYVSQRCPESMAWLHQCHWRCCIHLLRTRVQPFPRPVMDLERGFLESKPLAAGKPRRAGEPANNLCFCSGRTWSLGGISCSEELSALLFHFPTSVILYSHHFLKFIFHSRPFFSGVLFLFKNIWKRSSNGRKELSVFSVLQFLHVCIYSFNLCKFCKKWEDG